MERKPLAAMESREPIPVRFKPSERKLFEDAAREVGIGFTTFIRECAFIGLKHFQIDRAMKGHTRVTA